MGQGNSSSKDRHSSDSDLKSSNQYEERATGAAHFEPNKKTPSPPKNSKKKKMGFGRRKDLSTSSPALTSGSKSKDKFSKKKLEGLFEKYRKIGEEIYKSNISNSSEGASLDDDLFDSEEMDNVNVITPDAFARLIEDCGYDANHVLAFIVSWKLGATRMGCITKQQFIDGLTNLRTDSLDKLKNNVIPKLLSMYENNKKEVYMYAFNLTKVSSARTLDLESAIILLGLFLPSESYFHTVTYCQYLEEQQSYRAINTDQWSQTFDFITMMDEKCSQYSDDGAWPCIIDSYVEYFARPAEGT